MRKICFLFVVCYICMLSACTGGRRDNSSDDGRMVEMRYAELLTMRQGEGYTAVEIRNPWDSAALLHRYVLMPDGVELPPDAPDAEVVRVSLKNSAVYTSVLCGLIDELDAMAAVKGVCDLQYIYIDKVQQGVSGGSIADLGSSMTPDIEKLVDIHPDAMFISPFENSGSYGKLGKLHIPIIECADYMETSPLGRAEWIRFYGLLFGKQKEADSIFAAVEKNYNAMKKLAAKQPRKPTVVTEMKTGSTWYIAGNNSTVGRLIADAGGTYIFNDLKTSGAVPYSPEQAFAKAQKADFWLIKYSQASDMTMDELAAAWSSNKHIAAFRNGNVYGCNLAKTHFYEETPFHPDVLLRNIINIFHPGVVGDADMKYYKRLQP